MHSEKEWNEWITKYLDELKAVYDNSPKRVKEDYGNEAKVSSDYKGRAILELLQNADDAQIPEREKTDKIGKPEMYFVLKDGALYCANGGYQVTMGGLDSICRLSHSPKEVKDKKRLTIGEKGLGFKSVLSFSETPEIHSGNLHCFFSRKKSYKFISRTRQFKKISDRASEKNVPLLRIPNVVPPEAWKNDNKLVGLLKTCATVIKLPLTPGLKENEVHADLEKIEPTILLFLRHLEKITKHAERKNRIFSMNRGKPIKLDEATYRYDCSIFPDNAKDSTDWTVVEHLGPIPPDRLIGLGEGWEEMDTCCASFAIQKEKGKNNYLPISTKLKNKIRIYFPTDEEFYIPILFHATFFTNISRKTINPKILYNSFVVSEGVKAFLKYVLGLVCIKNEQDPGQHLDLFTTDIKPEELLGEEEDDDIGKMFIRNLYQQIGNYHVVPGIDGGLHPIGEIQVLDRNRKEWNDWYTLLGNKGCINLSLVHQCCRRDNRFRLIEYLSPNKISNENLVENLNNVPDELKTFEWCANTYLLLHRLVHEAPSRERKKWEEKYSKLRIIKLSDKTLTSNEENYKVFMPPSSATITQPPDWLKIKFVHPDLISLLQSKTNEHERDRIRTEYLDYFGVKQYHARDVVRECVTKDLNAYWAGEKTDVNLKELLFFLFNLQKGELRPGETPEPQIERYLKEIPVPSYDTNRNPVWSHAGETYASSGWTGDRILETLYSFDENSRFLREREYFEGDSDTWEVFLKWLGVSWVPRVVRLSTPMKHHRVAQPNVSQKLLKWSDYSSMIEKIGYDGCTIRDGRISLKENYILDRFFEICEDKTRQKVLLNLLARNPNLIDNIPNGVISYIPYGQQRESSKSLETNYQEWCLKNTEWLYGNGFSERFKPFELCIPIEGIYNVLGEYACYIDHKTETNPVDWKKMKSFLIKIGLSDSLEEFSLSQWYSILGNIPKVSKKINEGEAQKIRAIYRHFERTKLVPNTEEDKKSKEEFIENGKVLAKKGGEYLFVPPSEAFYVDKPDLLSKLDLLSKFEEHVPCFQVESKRSKRVRELFGITSLSESMTRVPEFGSLVKELLDPLNKFFNHSKHFLLARIRPQRADKTDSARLSKTEIWPVRRIKVKYGLKHNGETNWVYDGEVDSLVYQDGSGKSRGIYLNARLIQKSINSSEDFCKENLLIQEIAGGVAELLDVDLSEAFQLILSMEDAGRISLLKKSGLTDEILDECKLEIKAPTDIPDDGSEQPPKAVTIDTGTGEQAPATEQQKTKEPKKLKIWGLGDHETFNYRRVEPPTPPARKGGKGGAGGGNVPYQPDPDIRKATDNAGMIVVKRFEKDEEGRYPQDVSTQAQRLARGEGPGCDIHSLDKDGKLIRRIEVKSSLGDFTTLNFTKDEWDTARNKFKGESFYLYRVSKLDACKYPDGPELLIIQDPYGKELEALPSGYFIKIDPRKGELIHLAPFKGVEDEKGSEQTGK